MIIGERAVGELWAAMSRRLQRLARTAWPAPCDHRAAAGRQPSARPLRDFSLLLPACAAAHEEELGVDPIARDVEGFRWRTRELVEEGRSWLWLEDDVIRFKAEASAWTPSAVQLQQVWVDPVARRCGYGSRGLRDLFRLLLETTPAVTLFVRTDNGPAIALYESIGMRRVLSYRSILFP
jgi:GNAT superfamily N-acetyltransferase